MSRRSGSRALPLFGFLAACVATGIIPGCESPLGPQPLGPPLEISAEGISPSAVHLHWQPPPGGTVHHYRIDRATDPGGMWTRVGSSLTTEFVDDGCWPANKTFWYRLQSCTEKGPCGDFSTPVSAETWPEIPRDLTNLTLEFVEGEHIWVVWYHWSEDDPQELQRKVDGGSWSTIAEVEGGQFRDFEVEGGRVYRYRVRACNRTGCSEFTPEEEMNLVPPMPPGGISVEEYAMREFKLAWEVAEGVVAEYALERRVEGGLWEEIARTQEVRPQDLEYYNDGLSPETTYGYRVQACNVFGCSEPSAEVARATPPDVPPVTGRLVVPGGMTGGDTIEIYLHIVEDVNDLSNVRTVVTPQIHAHIAVRGTELWITNSGPDLLRIEMTTGEIVQRIGGDEFLQASGLLRLAPHGMMAPRPGGGILLSAALRADSTWGTAVFDASLTGLEAFIPFVSLDGVAFEQGGQEMWYLLGTRARESGEEFEVMVVTEGRLDEARYFPLGEHSSEAPTAVSWIGEDGSGASWDGSLGRENFVVDPAGVAYIALLGGLHRVSAVDGSYLRLELPSMYRPHMALGPEHVYVLPTGDGIDGPGPAVIYRVRTDFAGGLQLFASLAEEGWEHLNPEFTDIAVGPEGKRIYVAEGTWDRVSMFGFRELRVYAFDVATARLIERPKLGGYGRPRLLIW